MPKDQAELREIVRKAVGNKVRKQNAYIKKIEAQSNHWKLKYKVLKGQIDSARTSESDVSRER